MYFDKPHTEYFYAYTEAKDILDNKILSLNERNPITFEHFKLNKCSDFDEFKMNVTNMLSHFLGLREKFKFNSLGLCNRYIKENNNIVRAFYEKNFVKDSPEYGKPWTEIVKFSTELPETTKGSYDDVDNGSNFLDMFMNRYNTVLCKYNPSNAYAFLASVPSSDGNMFYKKQGACFKSITKAASVIYNQMMKEKISKGFYHHELNITGITLDTFEEYVNLGKNLNILTSEQEQQYRDEYSENQRIVDDYVDSKIEQLEAER